MNAAVVIPNWNGARWLEGCLDCVARQTLARAAELAVPVHILPQWYDVDDSESLKLLASELFEGSVYAAGLRPYSARHTRATLLSLIESSNLQNRLAVSPTLEGAAE